MCCITTMIELDVCGSRETQRTLHDGFSACACRCQASNWWLSTYMHPHATPTCHTHILMVALLMMVWPIVTLLHVSQLLSHSLFPGILPSPLPSRSICLMLQAALPCLLFAPETSRLVLRGGTNADMAPPIDYVVQVGC